MNRYDGMSTERLFGIARQRMEQTVSDTATLMQTTTEMLTREDDADRGLRLLKVQESTHKHEGMMAVAIGALERLYEEWNDGRRDDASTRESLLTLLQAGDELY